MSQLPSFLILFLTEICIKVVLGQCPYGYVAYQTDACFMFRHEQDVIYTADQAQRICKFTNGTLATIDDISQDRWLHRVFMHDRQIGYTVWIGLVKDKTRGGIWVWRDGSQPKFRNWNKGKPDSNTVGEDCAHYDVSYANDSYPDLGWNDDHCDDESYRTQGFICRALYRPTSKQQTVSAIQCDSSKEIDLFKHTGWAIGGAIGAIFVLILMTVLGVFVFKKCYFYKPSVPLTRFENVG